LLFPILLLAINRHRLAGLDWPTKSQQTTTTVATTMHPSARGLCCSCCWGYEEEEEEEGREEKGCWYVGRASWLLLHSRLSLSHSTLTTRPFWTQQKKKKKGLSGQDQAGPFSLC
jgi:hypothetical protein